MAGAEHGDGASPTAAPAAARRSALYGRQAGRPLRQRQRQALENALPRLGLDLSALADPGALFAPRRRGLWLEIGFGSGEHLADEAERHPEIGYLGCEPFRNGLAKMAEEAQTRGLGNVRLFGGDARLLIDALPPASLDGVDILYPDPWPKRRQRKRRIVSDETLARLAVILRPGAPLRFATDIDDYAAWTLARVMRNDAFLWPAETAQAWRHPWSGWQSTRYERKALAAGRRPVYLTFLRRP